MKFFFELIIYFFDYVVCVIIGWVIVFLKDEGNVLLEILNKYNCCYFVNIYGLYFMLVLILVFID